MEVRRPGIAGRVVAGACLLVAGIGVASAQLQLSFTHMAGGPTGDGGNARNANLHGVADVVLDSAGNMYVSQFWANRIRKVATNGTIATIVGGNTGFAGDFGVASNALINHPAGMAIDASGNLYFSDQGNARVRRIATNGVISTVAGNGSRVASNDGGSALNAGLDPAGLAIDSAGNLYIADRSNHRVRKVAPGGTITTFAGNGLQNNTGNNGPAKDASLSGPEGVDVDSAGNVYIADTGNSAVRKVNTAGTISVYDDTVTYPYNVEADATGATVWISSSDCRLLRRTLTTATWYGQSGVCGLAPEGSNARTAGLGVADGMAIDGAGNLFFGDTDNARVAKITVATDALTTYAGTKPAIPDGSAAASAPLSMLNGISVDPAGAVLLSDAFYAFRVRYLQNGQVFTLAGNGGLGGPYNCKDAPCNALNAPLGAVAGVAWGPGGIAYVVDRVTNSVYVRTHDGMLTRFAGGGIGFAEGASATTVALAPRGVAVDAAGNVYIAGSNKIFRVDTAGKIFTLAGTGAVGNSGDNGPATSATLNNPTKLAVDGAQNVYVYDAGNGTVRKIGTDNIIRRVAGYVDPSWTGGYSGEGGLATGAHLGLVTGLAAHSSGLYIASEGAIRRVRSDGKIETAQGFPYFAQAIDIRGQLYVATDSGRVVRAALPRRVNSDFGGDGRSDIVWRSTTGGNAIWNSANSGTVQAIPSVPTYYKLGAQGDFDGDGRADLAWRNTSTGANVLWRGGNSATTTTLTAVADQGWTMAGAGDFNADGKSDLVWRHKTTGRVQLWQSANSATSLALTTVADTRWTIVGIGDFDGDGKADLLWRNTADGRNAIWLGGLSTQQKAVVGVSNQAWKIVAIGDFDGDGVSDLLWRNISNGANTIWRSANNGTQKAIVGVTSMAWTVAAAGDYDNDGIDDLLWRNKSTGANTLWLNANNATQRAVTTVGVHWSVQPYEAQP